MKDEDSIKEMYRSYIELWASGAAGDKQQREVLHGAILAYGRVLGFSATKVYKDMSMAKNKYLDT